MQLLDKNIVNIGLIIAGIGLCFGMQLSRYFAGYTEICDLHKHIRKKQAAGFNLKQFHEQFLSYGSAPVHFIRVLMSKSK